MKLIDACEETIGIEYNCSRAVATSASGSGDVLRSPLLNLENAIIDAATSGLSDGSVYISTFLIDGRYNRIHSTFIHIPN